MKRASDRRLVMTLCAALAVGAVAVYWQAVTFAFLPLDDPAYVVKNWHVNTGLSLGNILWAFTSTHSANWHPLTWISHMLDAQIFGMRAGGHHLTSVLMHIASTVLLFLLLRRMTGFVWRSALVAALFGIHPLHAESVAWVAERKDTLSTLLWILTLWVYVGFAREPTRKRQTAVIALFALGLMAKPMLVTIPLVLLLLDYWPLGRMKPAKGRPLRQVVRGLIDEKIPLFGLAAASCGITFFAQQAGGAVRSMEQFSLPSRLANAVISYLSYVGKMFWPTNLSAYYPHQGGALPVWAVTLCGLAFVGLTYLAIRAGGRRPYLVVGWLWYVITLLPVVGIVQVGPQGMADRYTYVPLIGLFVMLAWAIPDALSSSRLAAAPRNAVMGVAAGAAIAALMAAAWFQAGYWKDGVKLFRHAVAVTSGCYMTHFLLADAMNEAGDTRGALYHLQKTAEAKPDFAVAHNRLGHMLIQVGRTREGLAEYRKALEADPKLAAAHNELGIFYVKSGRLNEALKEFNAAERLIPNEPGVEVNLGTTYLGLGDAERAIPHLEAALKLDPTIASAHYYLGCALGQKGFNGQAVEHLAQAARMRPEWAMAHYSLALALFQAGDYPAARDELQTSVSLGSRPNPSFVAALDAKLRGSGK